MKQKLFFKLFVILFFLILNSACFKQNQKTLIIENKIDPGNNNNVDGPPVTRSEVVLTGDNYTKIHWKMNEKNRSGTLCERKFTSYYPVGDRIGMGYKWGGWDNIEEFTEKIEQGCGTGTGGNVDYSHIPFECVTGISCTGFVSRAWHLDNKYTLNYSNPEIEKKFQEITHNVSGVNFYNQQTSNLKKGDAFINSQHIILFIYETRDGHPMIMDSSFEGVKFRQISWSYLANNGYIAIRYNNINDESNQQGTKQNPIIINSDNFPFTDIGNTRNIISMEFDNYSSSSNKNEQGPEVVYQLQLNSSGTIKINITDSKAEGIDNNVHLLKTLHKEQFKAKDCIASADNNISTSIDSGTYFLIVDSGFDYPGDYTLSINF